MDISADSDWAADWLHVGLFREDLLGLFKRYQLYFAAINLKSASLLNLAYLFTESLDFVFRDRFEFDKLLDLAVEHRDVLVVQDIQHGRVNAKLYKRGMSAALFK
jgi:hypothetical protein